MPVTKRPLARIPRKRQKSFRFSLQVVEILEYLQEKTGLDQTKTLERLVCAEAHARAVQDLELLRITRKTPRDYAREEMA